MRLCITGCAGFIGYWVTSRCLDAGFEVHGIDSLTPGHDPSITQWRLKELLRRDGFSFHQQSILDSKGLDGLAARIASARSSARGRPFDAVIHLVAQSNVRRSFEDPVSTYQTNVLGTLSMLKLCTDWQISRFVFASSASLYGGCPLSDRKSGKKPSQLRASRETDPTESLSPYAASKKAAEDLCRLYHRLHGINTIILRFFAPYGPGGRIDMSVFRFVRWMAENESILVYGNGDQLRDFVFVDDIARGAVAALRVEGCEIVNLGGGAPVSINHVLDRLEVHLGGSAERVNIPAPDADVESSWADITKAGTLLAWSPLVTLDEGLRRTAEWYVTHREWLRRIPLDVKPAPEQHPSSCEQQSVPFAAQEKQAGRGNR